MFERNNLHQLKRRKGTKTFTENSFSFQVWHFVWDHMGINENWKELLATTALAFFQI